MIITPARGRLYVQLEEVQEHKQGLIIVPDKHSVPSRKGTILAVGADIQDYFAGDKVIVNYYSGVVLDMYELAPTIGGGVDSYRIITPHEILATYSD
jgi:co-chaperonin GroES (HSP10)